MNGRTIVVMAAAIMLATAASCGRFPQKGGAPQPAAPMVARAGMPAAVQGAEPAPRIATAPGAESTPQIGFNASAPSITETLEKTVDMLLQAKAENERLKLTLADSDRKTAEKDAKIQELTKQLDVASGDVGKLQEALEKWKSDVLGFRDEMRKADEAEIHVLQEILMLLKGFAKEKPTQ